MTTELEPGAPAADITGLHHVGHVVRDMRAARALYRRLGFHVPPATYPALPPEPGVAPRAFGAGNTHAEFRDNFVELATVIDDDSGDGTAEDDRLHPIEAPPEVLARLADAIAATADRLRTALDRFEGLHILALHAPDADAAASRLTAAGIRHGGVHRLRRPVETPDGPRQEPVGYLELDDPERTPEGRLAVVEDARGALVDGTAVEHANGAIALAETVLCVPDRELAGYAERYRAYVGRSAGRHGDTRQFELGGARLVLVAESGLGSLLPGEGPVPVPGFAAYTVAVRDIGVTRAHLISHDIPFRQTPRGELLVPSSTALGCAIVFRQHGARP